MPGHEVVAVVTQPDRPKGRDLKPAPPPIKVAAERLGIPVQQPLKIREPAAIDSVRAEQPTSSSSSRTARFCRNRFWKSRVSDA
jgi:methionyl-tRNA formyltransferase